MGLDGTDFRDLAVRYHRNTGVINGEEFRRDLDKFRQLKRAFRTYKSTGSINVRLVLNQLTTLYNIFKPAACTVMLMQRLSEEADVLRAFLEYQGYWPVSWTQIHTDDRVMDLIAEEDRMARS